LILVAARFQLPASRSQLPASSFPLSVARYQHHLLLARRLPASSLFYLT